MGFDSRPLLHDPGKAANGRAVYVLAEPLTFRVGWDRENGLTVSVPAGFATDLASVPRLLWPIVPPAGAWSAAAIVHDSLYGVPGCSRFLADAIFREAMAHLGVPWWRRVLMYYAVRLLGGKRKKRGVKPQKDWP